MDDNYSCFQDPKKNRYIFYEHTDKYMQYEKNCLKEEQYNQYGSKCESIGSAYAEQENIISTICLKFHCLMNNIFNSKSSQYDQNELAHLEYLNYWLNYELYLNNAIICPKSFYQNMISLDKNNDIILKLRKNNNYIVNEEVRNMYALYHLYDKYVKMKEILMDYTPVENAFFSYARNIVEKYRELAKNCTQNKNFLCDALNVFKEKYNKIELKGEILSYWENKTLPALVESGHSQEEITESSTRNREVSQTSSEEAVTLNEPKPEDSVSEELSGKNKVSKENPEESIGNSVTSTGESSNHTSLHLLSSRTSLQGGTIATASDEDRSTELQSEGDLSDYTRTIIGPAVGTIGLSSIFFIFYKFTSFGVLMFRGRRNNKKIGMNFDEQRNLFLDTSEYHHEYPSRKTYNIAYNSA
ncbi:Plasmodium vivax Vir protein/Plasmodium variant antigen protein Cir/Yir/Bir, putative [Plasmodium vivax]|uniref:Vir protein/Plasmodium variant antigen protein Cir/Yir/Bir, putative n=1 Tax=Plasmodium vivax TaxID=5855 RepID=A0A1G4GU53_PLAVI|nr:Plasmodium vivax Vir protein/Plasmodium variant antigen protein Cir/Yir/Bir, putative [Plasmodium vivax]